MRSPRFRFLHVSVSTSEFYFVDPLQHEFIIPTRKTRDGLSSQDMDALIESLHREEISRQQQAQLMIEREKQWRHEQAVKEEQLMVRFSRLFWTTVNIALGGHACWDT